MNIVIVGAGALGSLFGGLLARSGEQVWLYNPSFRAHIDAIRARGLLIETGEASWRIQVSATTELSEIEPSVDLLGLFVKAYDTKAALEDVRPLIGPQSWALSLQNGLGSEEIIARFVPAARLLRGSTAQGATLLEPGRIRWAGQGPTVVGLLSGAAKQAPPQAQEIIAALARAGLPAGFTRQLEAVLWEKLLVNAAINPLTALLDLPNGRLVEEPTLRAILSDIIAEALPLARQHGVRLSPEEAVAHVEEICRATSGNISSMLQDLRGGKRTEIDFITGALLEEGRRRGRSLPLNRLLWALISRSTRQARHHRV